MTFPQFNGESFSQGRQAAALPPDPIVQGLGQLAHGIGAMGVKMMDDALQAEGRAKNIDVGMNQSGYLPLNLALKEVKSRLPGNLLTKDDFSVVSPAGTSQQYVKADEVYGKIAHEQVKDLLPAGIDPQTGGPLFQRALPAGLAGPLNAPAPVTMETLGAVQKYAPHLLPDMMKFGDDQMKRKEMAELETQRDASRMALSRVHADYGLRIQGMKNDNIRARWDMADSIAEAKDATTRQKGVAMLEAQLLKRKDQGPMSDVEFAPFKAAWTALGGSPDALAGLKQQPGWMSQFIGGLKSMVGLGEAAPAAPPTPAATGSLYDQADAALIAKGYKNPKERAMLLSKKGIKR